MIYIYIYKYVYIYIIIYIYISIFFHVFLFIDAQVQGPLYIALSHSRPMTRRPGLRLWHQAGWIYCISYMNKGKQVDTHRFDYLWLMGLSTINGLNIYS